MSAPSKTQAAVRPMLLRRPHFWRDNIEGLLTAVVLALIIRHFVFEVFEIPTGSMAPTLLGQHRDLECPNCELAFPVDSADSLGDPKVIEAMCPNCGYVFPREIVRRTFCTCFPQRPRRLFWRGGNRVIVNKFICRFCPPERWDIIVFRYPRLTIKCRSCGRIASYLGEPNGRLRCPGCESTKVRKQKKNYIKRLVGLPGETVEIRHGDVYVDGRLRRKPREVQDDLWQLVYDSSYTIRKEQEGFHPRWVPEIGSFSEDSGVLELIPGADRVARVRYGPKITDRNAYNDASSDEGARLGDLRLDVRVRLDRPGAMRLQIHEDNIRYVATIRFGEAPFRTAIHVRGKPVVESEFTADPALEHHVVFSNVDDRRELWVDGRLVLAHEHDVPPTQVPEVVWGGGAFLSVEGARATLSRIRLEQDLFYVSDAPGTNPGFCPIAEVPADHYFVLGDNSRKSSDSRYWGLVPAGNLIGKAEVVWWPLPHLRVLR